MGVERTFLSGIVDYAGLFPPAQLPLDQALDNYLRYRTEAGAWMLGRFVCPAARLGEMAALAVTIAPPPLPIAALGRGGQNAQEYFANVKADLADVARFHEAVAGRAVVDVYEARLPPTAFEPMRANQISSLIATTAYLIDTSGPPALTPFFEAPANERAPILALIQALHEDSHSSEARGRRRCQGAGFKLRTGGLEAKAFPPVELVALALAACRAAAVPFKATAGLHHPFRHADTGIGATMHGFVNVFAAGCLALAHPLDEAQVRAIVAEEDTRQFRLDTELRWRDLSASAATVTAARKLFVSFGSCSFDEPRDDLRRWGME